MDFNIAPYYDDFDETKKFYKILFRPGVAVQTREVNQLQSILQDQIAKFGNHMFKEGSMVIPGQVNYNDKLRYLKLTSTSLGDWNLTDLEDKFITDNINYSTNGVGVVAQVLKAIPATDTTPITLVLLYTQGNQTVDGASTGKEFLANATLYVADDTTKTLNVASGTVSGRSVAAGLQAGVYFLAGHFVTVDSQLLSVKTYAETVADINVRIGIQYTESIITSDTDDSLYDNATGSPNFAAPGAHRYKIQANFVQVGLDENPENFFELLRVEEGVVQTLVNASQYNILEETLARRTYDESGNYVTDDFKFDIREARNSARGSWAPGQTYLLSDVVQGATGRYFTCVYASSSGAISGSTEPANFSNASVDESYVITDGGVKWRYVSNPISNRGLNQDGSSSNLVATFGIGKAYVQGYEISKISNSNITIPKARDVIATNNQSTPLLQGNYIYVDKKYTVGIPDLSAQPPVQLFDRFIYKGSGNKFGLGQQVGSARITWTEPDSRGFIKVGLGNITMNPGKNFDRDVNSIAVADSTTSYAVTSYTATSFIKYSGSSTSSYIQISGAISTSAQAATTMIVSGTGTAFQSELIVGDVLTQGTSSHGVTSSWTVTQIVSQTTMVLSGSPLAATAASAALVRLPAQTVFGHQTAIGTRFQSEYRVGDTIWLGVNGNSSVVTNIINESRMTVSGNVSLLIAQTSHGTYYINRVVNFGADIAGNYQYGINAKKLTGQFSLSDYSGGTTVVQSYNAVRINGTNDTKMLTELATNDYVDINGNRLFITKVSSNTVAFGVNIEATTQGATTTYPGFKVNNNLVDGIREGQLFRAVPTVMASLADNIFTVYKSTSVTIASGASQLTLSLSAASGADAAEAAATTDPGAYFLAQNAVGTLSGPISVNNVSLGAGTITLTFNSSSSTSVRVIYPVTRAAASATDLGRLKSKTLVLADVNGGTGYDDFLTTSAATKAILYLSKSDIYRKVKIYMANAFYSSWNITVQTNATDVTSRYQLDNGQRPSLYDVGNVRLVAGFPQATGSIRVYYDYFEHGNGDFFAKKSYTDAGIPYENTPEYNGVNLADVLDFRARINTSNGTLVNAAPPRFGTSFISDLSYYTGRKDKILLDRSGSFYKVGGVSGLVPQIPKITSSDNAIELYDLELAPYTKTAELPNVKKTKYDNRRYTMKDIGSIEKRVANLEETTALSLLESKTSTMQIRDNRDSTLERYKTGFFVDNFGDNSNGEMGGDARFSIDFENRTLNSQISYNKFPLVEKLNMALSTSAGTVAATNTFYRAAANYKISGDLLTLNYTTSVLMEQALATTSIAIAPFVTATFLGSLRVVPDKDVYEDVHNKDVITKTVNNQTPEQLAAQIAALRSWWNRPYRVETVTVNTYVDTTKTQFLIPFCRANTVLIIGKGLKPNTKFYPYFDDMPISEYVTGAMKFTFSALPIIDFEGSSPKVKTEWPRWRSLYESKDMQEVVRSRQVFSTRQVWVQNRGGWGWGGWGWGGWGGQWVTETTSSWVYDYGWFRRVLNPANYDQNLPSAAGRDAYRPALGIGTSVYYYENGKAVGSGVGVYQEGASLYIVNGRGKLAPSFLRNAGSYNYSGVFYISVEGSDGRYLPTQAVTAASCLTSDSSGNLFTNASGVAVGIFDLPDTDTVKFTTGKKPVTLTDHPDNDPDEWTSKADGQYYVEGWDVTFTHNYISTKNYVLRPYDPIAQSFKIPSQFDNGCFITDIDIFFQAKPVAEPAVVALELRTCDSTGRPSGTEMVPGSEVTLRPDQVNIDATKGQIPTKFTFRQPIYLMPEKQYAFVLRTDTKNYRVWMATMGGADVNDPTKSYTTQALFGSLFKSQDGTLWTEDQTSDLKFRINRAVFDTRDTGADVYVVNSDLTNDQLPSNPLTFVHGSNKIRVSQKDHGFSSGDTTRLYSQYWAQQYALLGANATINGIPVGEIFGAYVSSNTATYRPDNASVTQPKLIVSDVTLDTYTVTVSSVANIAGGTTGYTAVTAGGTDIFGHKNVLYHAIKPSASIMKSAPTGLTFQATMVKGFTYDTDANATAANYSTYTQSLNFNDYTLLDTSTIILSDVVEYSRLPGTAYITGGFSDIWTDSFVGKIHLSTTSDHVSPAVDMTTLRLDTMQHRIDNPSYSTRLPVIMPATPGVGSSQLIIMSTIANSATTISFDAATRKISTTVDGGFYDVTPGRYVTISGSSSNNNYTSTAVLVTSIDPDGKAFTVSANLVTTSVADGITIRQIDDFNEEATFINGTGESKYITNVINLANPASMIKMMIEACVPSAADFDVYYKVGSAGSNFSAQTWTKYIAPNQYGTTSSYTNLVKSDKRKTFTDVEIDICTYDSINNPVDLNPFTAFQVKIVMRSSNAARIPQFRNLRLIAHA